MKGRILTLSCWCFIFLAPAVDLKSLPVVTHPVLLLPGLSASQIEARLDKDSAPHFFCKKHTDWFRIWFAPFEFLPEVLDCFVDNFRLVFNEQTGRTENPPGVQTRVMGFGQTEQIEFLSSLKFGPGMLSLPRVGQLPHDSHTPLFLFASCSRQPTTSTAWLSHLYRWATCGEAVCAVLRTTLGDPFVSVIPTPIPCPFRCT